MAGRLASWFLPITLSITEPMKCGYASEKASDSRAQVMVPNAISLYGFR